MKRIFMYWFKMPEGEKNFGDEVGPYVVSRLSESIVSFVNPNRNFLIKSIFHKQKRGNLRIKDILAILLGQKKVLVSVGSILNHYNIPTCNVWGAGIITRKDRVQKANFFAVRGKYSQERLKELKYKAPQTVGDPALLLSLVTPIKMKKKYKLGIIPHYVHYEEVKMRFKTDDILVINLLEPNVETIIENINTCDYMVSSSLHGIIVSHTYKIPCIWFELAETPLFGDNVKFYDYFSSVGINDYNPFKLPDTNDMTEFIKEVTNIIKGNPQMHTIQVDLKKLQIDLLKSAPFKIKKEFKL
ncbi:MAG: polysaccharide pyruvyl transferase family protein [Flavobacteriaceae bacterium]